MPNYVPRKNLQDAVEGKNIDLARQILQATLNNSAMKDHVAMDEFDWAVKKLPAIVVDFDAKDGDLSADTTHWSEDYYLEKKVELNANFCRERFEHLVKVRNHLRALGHPKFRQKLPHVAPGDAKKAPSAVPLPGMVLATAGVMLIVCVAGLTYLISRLR